MQYLCPSDYREPFDFRCTQPPNTDDGLITDWFTVCGVPNTSFSQWISLLVGVCTLGLGLYSNVLNEEKVTLKPLVPVKKEKNL